MNARREPARGFSFIELMIVLVIISIILGMSGILLRREGRDAHVKAAAEQLAGVLREVRERAMHDQSAYAVVFTIQNEPGTSGAVLNNWSGGHSYRIIGPSVNGYNGNSHGVPLPGATKTNDSGFRLQANLPDFIESLKEAQFGSSHILPAHKVRFLALGDTDEGQRETWVDWSTSLSKQTFYGSGGETTYPRPWFGYYDSASQRLFPWGGYDPSKDFSGFYYEGLDGDVVGCRNQTDRFYQNDFDRSGTYANTDRNGDGDFDDLREREVNYPIWKVGEDRSLVNGEWMDSGIMFVPTGEAIYFVWNQGRRAYQAVQSTGFGASGVADRAKRGRIDIANIGSGSPYDAVIGEVAHFDRHTGGWHITLGPDAQLDSDRFPSAKSALDSILPAYRVYVGRSGVVRVMRVQRRGDEYLNGHTVWPSVSTDWDNATFVKANPVWNRCRLGFLHTYYDKDDFSQLEPSGKPIVDIVTERMMTDRIWWFDE